MPEFQILIEAPAAHDPSGPGRLSIRLGESYLTRLVRRSSHEPDDCLEAPPVPLAFWFVDNWWRIRSEPPPHRDLDAEWRLAHHLSSVGAGYHWPNVSLWGEGSRFGVAVHADASNLQPSLKFVAPPRLDYVPSSTVEEAIDRFVLDVLTHVGTACDGLDAEYDQLRSERADPEVAAWRTLEAMLGFDPDDAPEGLVRGFEVLTDRYGAEPLQEAALAHQGVHATAVLDDCIEAAERSNVIVRAPFEVEDIQIDRSSLQPPWALAVNTADRLRHRLGVPPGPLRNTRLSEIVGINVDHLKPHDGRASTFPMPSGCATMPAVPAGSPCARPGLTRGDSSSAGASATSSGRTTTHLARCPPRSPSARSSSEPSRRRSSARSPTFRRTSTPKNRARTTSTPQPDTFTSPNA